MVLKLGKDGFVSPRGFFPIAMDRFTAHAPWEIHTHDYSELVVILGGRGVHVIDGRSYAMSAGDVFVVGGQSQLRRELLG